MLINRHGLTQESSWHGERGSLRPARGSSRVFVRTAGKLVAGGARLVVLSAAALLLLVTAPDSRAASPEALENWPQWRGPLSTGVSPTAQPPVEWSETKNVKWKVAIPGRGSATPIIWNDRIFIQTAIGPEQPEPAEPDGDRESPDRGASRPERGRDGGPAPDGDRPERSGERQAERGPPGPFGPGGRGGPGRRGRGMRSPQPTEPYQFVLQCLDRQTGETLWQRVAREEVPHEGHHPDHGFASHSPVTDGTHVFAYFGSRGIHCYDVKGNPVWQKDLGRMETKMSFGEGSSPALHGNVLVVNWDHEGEDFIVAFDKSTGRELWRQPREEDTTWATPLVVEHDGKAQVVTAATNKIRSYDLESGEVLWETEGLTPNAIPSPVADDGFVYAMSGFRGSKLLAIRLGGAGDLSGTDYIAWTLGKGTPYVPSPLLYENRLYFFSGNNAILTCLDARTGEPLIETTRLEGLQNVYASPVGADGRAYLIGRNGVTLVIKNADQLEVLAQNELDEGFDASPALAGKELFLRGQKSLYCICEE